VDTSASHPHRKPGRTQVDFVTTAGSRVITSATIQCSGGDVGQGLLLTYPDTTTQSMVATSCTTSTGLWGNGMNGVFGTNLTMASVTPVASTRATVTQGSNVVVVTSATGIANGQVVVMNTLPTNLETTVTNVSGTSITLSNYTQCVNNCSTLTVPIAFYDATAAQATESQTGVTGYLSWGGIPVTETMGVCAFCIDDHDATTAGVPYALLNGSHFEDFNIVTTSNTAVNHSVAIGAQGKAGAFYNANFIHGRISGFAYGIINYPQDTATTNASNGGDQNTFRDLNIGCTHPVTIYNSSYSRIGDIQMSGTGNTGFHLLQSHNVNAEPSNIWEIDISEIEQGLGTINLRIEGYGHTVHRFNASSQGITIWDANASICLTCAPRGTSTGFPSTFLVNGTQNTIPIKDSVNQLIISGDPIGGNRITGLRQTSTAGGMSVWTRPVTFLGRDCVANDRTADFLNGSAAAPFLNMCDLWFWPVDNFPASGVRPILIDDPTSETGMYEKMTVNEILNGTSAWPSGKLIIGSTSGQRANLPAKPVTLNIRVKCPSITSFTLDPAVYTGTSTLVNDFGAKTITCSTTYTTQSITIDLTSYGGGVNWLRLTYGGVTGNEVDEAWIGISPISGPFTATNFTSLSGTNDLTASATKVVTASPGDNTTNAASTAFVTNAVASAAGTACATEWVSTGQAGTRITNGFSNVTNQTRIWSFTPLCSMSFTKITWSIATADNTANLYDIGIYNANGSTLVCHIGATAGTTFAPSTNATVTASTIGTCALTAGTRYILAQTGNASTAILNSSGNTLLGVSAATVTTATTGGVLNSTLTIPADNWAANAFPLFTLHN
jgi:hypothetical protein